MKTVLGWRANELLDCKTCLCKSSHVHDTEKEQLTLLEGKECIQVASGHQPSRHHISRKWSWGEDIQDQVESAAADTVDAAPPWPMVDAVYDITSGFGHACVESHQPKRILIEIAIE